MSGPRQLLLRSSVLSVHHFQLAWPGKVIDGVFRGPRRSLTVETVGLSFNVECPATRAAQVGETVTLLVDADNAWALRPDGAAGRA